MAPSEREAETEPSSSRRPEVGRREDLSVSEVLYVLWGRKKLVAAVVIVLAVAALLFGISRERTYTAQAVILVSPQQQDLSPDEKTGFLERVSGVVASDEFLRQVARQVGWRGNLQSFRSRLQPEYFVRDNGQSGLTVRFDGEAPKQASRAANAYADLFVSRVGRLGRERPVGGSLAADARVESRASAGRVGINTGPLLYVALAVVAGVVIGGAAALLLEGRARSWRGPRDAEMTLHAPVLGVIPDYHALDGPPQQASERKKAKS